MPEVKSRMVDQTISDFGLKNSKWLVDSDRQMKERRIFIKMQDFTIGDLGVFIGTIGGVVTSILVILQKSKCIKLDFCGCHCIREIDEVKKDEKNKKEQKALKDTIDKKVQEHEELQGKHKTLEDEHEELKGENVRIRLLSIDQEAEPETQS